MNLTVISDLNKRPMASFNSRCKLIKIAEDLDFNYITAIKFSRCTLCKMENGELLKDNQTEDFIKFILGFYFYESIKSINNEVINEIVDEVQFIKSQMNSYICDVSLIIGYVLTQNNIEIKISDIFLSPCEIFPERDIGDPWYLSTVGRFIIDGSEESYKLFIKVLKDKSALVKLARLKHDLNYKHFEQYYSRQFQNKFDRIIKKYE